MESAAGIADGGRTGKTSIITGTLFILTLFIAPVVAVVGQGYPVTENLILYPVTAPALILVGFFMIGSIKQINLTDFEEGIPAFLTILFIPLTYQISVGIGMGFISYVLIKIVRGKWCKVHPLLYLAAALFGLSFFVQ